MLRLLLCWPSCFNDRERVLSTAWTPFDSLRSLTDVLDKHRKSTRFLERDTEPQAQAAELSCREFLMC